MRKDITIYLCVGVGRCESVTFSWLGFDSWWSKISSAFLQADLTFKPSFPPNLNMCLSSLLVEKKFPQSSFFCSFRTEIYAIVDNSSRGWKRDISGWFREVSLHGGGCRLGSDWEVNYACLMCRIPCRCSRAMICCNQISWARLWNCTISRNYFIHWASHRVKIAPSNESCWFAKYLSPLIFDMKSDFNWKSLLLIKNVFISARWLMASVCTLRPNMNYFSFVLFKAKANKM